MNSSPVPSHSPEPQPAPRRFRPKWWAALLTLVFAALTVHLGNWQGGKADYKLAQQAQLDHAMAQTPRPLAEMLATPDTGTTLRYHPVTVRGRLDSALLFYVDNRILDGKAGYDVLQVMQLRGTADEPPRYALVDRGWVIASPNRAQLPVLDTPVDEVEITARINLPRSRNPGTQDNAGVNTNHRINYVNIEELSRQLKLPLLPLVLEQTAGAGHLGTVRPPPAQDFTKNRAYQVQWYAFAVLSLVLFMVLSFRKQETVR